jgi:HlyD family secretion protein
MPVSRSPYKFTAMSKIAMKWKLTGGILLFLLVLSVVAKRQGWIGAKDATRVYTEKAELRDIIETVSANGKVQPEVELKITADVSGEITQLDVREGQVVKKGTLLCRINPEVYVSSLERAEAAVNTSKANLLNSKSRLTQAQAQFQQSELNFNRNQKLFDEKVISPAEFDNIRSTFEVARAEVDAARQSVSAASFSVNSAEAGLKESRENLNRTSIYAPVDGTISSLSKEKGERVVGTNMMEGTEIMRLANLNEMEVSVDVSETDIVRVSEGDTADVEIDAWLGTTFRGIVTEVANSSTLAGALPTTDQVTNYTVKVRILRESYAHLLQGKPANYSPFRPGMSATVDIRTRTTPNTLSVPIQAVTTRDTAQAKGASAATEPDEVVFVQLNGKAVLRKVKTGIQDNQFIQIVEGLKVDDEVIAGPYSAVSKSLKNDEAVEVVSKEDLFEGEKD